jgi:hypothetical protein
MTLASYGAKLTGAGVASASANALHQPPTCESGEDLIGKGGFEHPTSRVD